MSKAEKFQDLVDWAHSQYEKHLPANAQEKLKVDDRMRAWSEMLDSTINIKDVLNPYFIGYGNPMSDVLIIGKELGFEISNQNQVINESLENTFHWKCINNGVGFDIDHFKSPLRPYGGIQSDFSSGHTWRLYRKFILNLGLEIADDKSFLDHCFLTEFNYAPSQYSPGGVVLDEERKKVLSHDYFKTFHKVLLTYRSYDKVKLNQGLTEDLFDVEFIKMDKCGKQVYLQYTSPEKDRTAILTNQLSGGATWSTEELKMLAELFKG